MLQVVEFIGTTIACSFPVFGGGDLFTACDQLPVVRNTVTHTGGGLTVEQEVLS